MPLYKCINLDQSNSTIVKEDTQDGTTTVDIISATESINASAYKNWIACIYNDGEGVTELPEWGDYIGDYAFAHCTQLALTELPQGVTTIGDHAFDSCENLSITDFPGSVSSIGDYAFQFCTSLKDLYLPSDLEYLGSYAFYYCSNMSLVTIIPETLTYWGSMPFEGTNVRIGNIPSNVTSFGYAPFSGVTLNMTPDDFPKSITSIPSGFFTGCTMSWEYLPSTITDLSSNSFSGVKGLNDITIDVDQFTSLSLPSYAFSNCPDLEYVRFPGGSTLEFEIGDYCFAECSSFLYAQINSSVAKIGNFAFQNCSKMEEIYIPECVTSIGYNAFDKCSSLKKVSFQADDCANYANLTMSNIFSNCNNITEIYVNWSKDNDRENGGVITLWKNNYLPNATVTFEAGC